ncbi:TIGR00730 family Rossman fold protein [bacterium]|nr:TIGR00730 family Rossman fold protein [bacterium]
MKFSVRSACLFCGAQQGNDSYFCELAYEVGKILGQKNIRLVYGGSKDGLMGAAANGTLAAGGEVLGVLPEKLANRELAHPSVQRMVTVDTMARRKDVLMSESDLFIVLPGGLGTLDELFEVLTANTLGFMNKPVIVLNSNGYYTGLIEWLEQIAGTGLSKRPAEMITVVADVPSLAGLLA